MAKHSSPLRLDESLVLQAQVIGAAMQRSTNEQIEHWSQLGRIVSNKLTAQQVLSLITGEGDIDFKEPQPITPLDVMALAREVDNDSFTGVTAAKLLEKGNTLYEPAIEENGLLVACYPDGSRVKGHFRGGKFKPLKGQSVA